ncbi:glycosyltransferase [Nonlabens ulvanivorans]|uniref:glycosyltransferase n=1 Tax=Nonlabens ulvanivorans TaxID=906888 RepID=UPI002943490E|nr:glycosyltransferase [Nonlabens ulvanivorans]WOI22861.1 glycosyltransferase [Nonlabens ulvanivorans]
MRILLIGEYSGFHNSLKYGLQQLGHEVTLVGDGDGFKKFPVDIEVGSDYFRRDWLREKVKVAWWKLTGHNLEDNIRLARFRESEHLMKGYDIVQFINSNALGCEPPIEWQMIDYLLKNNNKAFLVACGDDYPYAQFLTEKHQGYSILTPYLEDTSLKNQYLHTFKYLKKGYRENYNRLLSKCKAIIPSHTDFQMALSDESKCADMIPSAIIMEQLELHQNHIAQPIEIFMGINRGNYFKKGIPYFEKALDILKSKYGQKVNITIAENLPYDEYIKSYRKSHILLDQALSYDQGYNALEAMAQGKVVFAGAGTPFLKAYELEKAPLIDAKPDVDYLVQELSNLIDHPDEIFKLGREAREFIERHHNAIDIARKYQALYIA